MTIAQAAPPYTEWFTALQTKRQNWITASTENNFREGIRRALVDKYAGKEHFLYELLQNADDQRATKTQFILTPDSLIFSHNGNGFTRIDVENITGIGNTAKAQRVDKIGQFGLGFKSVFVITDRPEVYTTLEEAPFAFAIEDEILPKSLPASSAPPSSGWTRFKFPFRVGESADWSKRINVQLRELAPQVLLFLNSLSHIGWQSGNVSGAYSCDRGETTPLSGHTTVSLITVRSDLDTVQKESRVYQEYCAPLMLGSKTYDVRLAFRVEEANGRVTQLLPETNQPVNVFFTTKEKPGGGLSFRLHAPFLLNDNRENIRENNPNNTQMITACKQLLITALADFGKRSLITTDFLESLPIQDSIRTSEFAPLLEGVKEAFTTYSLLPAYEKGRYVKAANAVVADGEELRQLVSDTQLTALRASSVPLHWLTAGFTRDRLRNLYPFVRTHLNVPEQDSESLYTRLNHSFLEKQDDAWLIKLYGFLHDRPKGWQQHPNRVELVRREDGRHVFPFQRDGRTPNVFLPVKGSTRADRVKRVILADAKAHDFLVKGLGLTTPSAIEEVLDSVVARYQNGDVTLGSPTYSGDLDSLEIALMETNAPTYQQFIETLNATAFVRATNVFGKHQWKKPSDVYMHSPELELWFEGNPDTWFADPLFGHHSHLIQKTNIADTVRIHKQPSWRTVGGHVIITNMSGDHKRGLNGFDPTTKIDGLEHALQTITVEKAAYLWNNLLLGNAHLLSGTIQSDTRQNFPRPKEKRGESHVGTLCRESAWLPDATGIFQHPSEIALADLPDEFEKDSNSARVIALADRLQMRQLDLTQAAEVLNISVEQATAIKHNPHAFQQWVASQSKATAETFPTSIAPNSDRRESKAAEAAASADHKETVMKERSVRVSAYPTPEKKAYLSSMYRTATGRMVCQICENAMPFKLHSEDYFETPAFIGKDIAEELLFNCLALCPNCTEEFIRTCANDDKERRHRLMVVVPDATKELYVDVEMDVHKRIRFVHKHLIDLRGALKAVR